MHRWRRREFRTLKPEPRNLYQQPEGRREIRYGLKTVTIARPNALARESRQGIDPKLNRSAQPIWGSPPPSLESPSTEVIASYIDWSRFSGRGG